MKRFHPIGLLSLFTALILAAVAMAGVPHSINYQGYLKDGDGTPVNGEFGMAFALYSSNPHRNNPVWSEPEKAVVVTNGIYSTQIGSEGTPLRAHFDVPYYLAVIIKGVELPLQPLSSVPYAQRAAEADRVTSVTTTMIADGAVTGPKVADGAITSPKIADKAVTAAKIGAVCSDGDVLRYDKPSASWTCNPLSGGFPSALPFVGAVTIEGMTSATLSSTTMPDQYRDILLYGFDMKFVIAGLPAVLTLDPIKVICDPKQFTPLINLAVANYDQFSAIGLWLPGSGSVYGRYLYLQNVMITGIKPILPTRKGDTTLIELTLSPQQVTFISPANPEQNVVVNMVTNTVTGCSHTTPLVFTVTHGLPVNLSNLGEPVYPITTYATMIDASLPRPYFGFVTVSGNLASDGPCLMTDLSGRITPQLFIYTAGAENSNPLIQILESRLRLEEVSLTSYRLFASSAGKVQQEAGYLPSKMYWGYYPYNPETMTNGPLEERGWNIETNQPL
ncbi:MAG: hypothetical protein IPQ16_14040 [Geobacteraceae bacterium]|nr:hypothetical protein [Geobacteraceae bacterium]